MDRASWLSEKEGEIRSLAGMSLTEVMPSRRDFTLFVATQKQSIALVPRLKRLDPDTGGAWPETDLIQSATAFDDAETAAIAVCTSRRHGGSIDDLRSVAGAVTAPVLRDDLILDRYQLYHSRLHGADAVILPAAHLERERLRELSGVAASLHMAVVVEVTAEAQLEVAIDLAPACIGLRCQGPGGFADLEAAAGWARRIPAQRIVLLLDEVRGLDDLRAAIGQIDAAVVGDALLGDDDPVAAIAAFTSHAG